MKKVFLAIVLSIAALSGAVAQHISAPTELNKIGGYLGWPLGLSYGRKLSSLVELDVVAGIDSYSISGYINDSSRTYTRDYATINGYGIYARVAPLFRCWEGHLWPGAYGKLAVGPAVGLLVSPGAEVKAWYYDYDKTVAFDVSISAPVRFDIDFRFPLNLFVEVAPAGFSAAFANVHNGELYSFYYYFRSAVGVRYRF